MKTILCTIVVSVLPFAAAAAELKAAAPHPVTEAAVTVPAAKLPSIATLDKSSDYSVFVRPGVPATVQRQALRKLWAAMASELPANESGGGLF